VSGTDRTPDPPHPDDALGVVTYEHDSKRASALYESERAR
jgi:hypothetical protein